MPIIARSIAWLVVVAIIHSAAAADLPAAHWPRWRGPGADSSAPAGKYAVKFNATEGHAWKVALPGKGCSSPAVWGDKIIVSTPVDGKNAAICFDLDGKERWRTTIGNAREGKHRNGSASNPSPVTDGKYVFFYYKSGEVAGLDIEGKLLWSTNLQEKYGKDTLYWDIGTSPVVTEKHVVVAVMHEGESFLVAFDKATGEVAWKVSRNYKCPTEGDHAYTTPILIRHDNRDALLVWGAEHLTAHDAADGKVLWSCGEFNPQKKGNWVAVASAVVSGDMAIVPYGRGSHLAGVKLGGSGDVTATHRAWTINKASCFVPTPAVSGGKVYVVGDRGEVACVDPKDGATVWTGELPKKAASYYASPLVAGDKLYATREDGVIFVVSIAGKLSLLSENDMGERVIASPVPVNGKLLIRGEKHLFCIAAAP